MDKKDRKKQVHKDLEGFDVKINHFGQIESNFDISKVNEFLNKKTDDKKMQGQSDAAKDEEE